MLLIVTTVREYISLFNPIKIVPAIIIKVFIIKFDIDTFIFKYFFKRRFIIVIPPDEKFILYIIPPVVPHIIPAIIDDINLCSFIIVRRGIYEVIFTNMG